MSGVLILLIRRGFDRTIVNQSQKLYAVIGLLVMVWIDRILMVWYLELVGKVMSKIEKLIEQFLRDPPEV